MQVATLVHEPGGGWRCAVEGPSQPQLILAFIGPDADPAPLVQLEDRFPSAALLATTTGGEIAGIEVLDGSCVAAAVRFDTADVQVERERFGSAAESFDAARRLGARLSRPSLRVVFLLVEGLDVNGSAIVAGLRDSVGEGVIIVGGLAGDGSRFAHTRVGSDSALEPRTLVAVGLGGERLEVGHGSRGGWKPFGPLRQVTRASGNVLFELDGLPALDLYKRYLGPEADQLPSSALLYPLAIRRTDQPEVELVRTVLAIDEATRSMTFAGDIPEGAAARLMHASIGDLVEGAASAAQDAGPGQLAILVSCIGRRLLMGQRTAEELEAVAETLGPGCTQVGFYSYGEISPHVESGCSDLHNQTMTITTLREI